MEEKDIRNSKYQNDDTPLDLNCKNFNLNKYTKNYLNHLFNTNEVFLDQCFLHFIILIFIKN